MVKAANSGLGLSRETRLAQGFKVYVLANDRVEVQVVPELGARIISLKNLRSGREWMWHPAGGLKLFRNKPGDDFSRSPLAGMDECLPTIAPCVCQKRKLPDHGEVWASSWSVNDAAWDSGLLITSIRLKVSPLVFQRVIALHGESVQLNYRLENRGTTEEQFLWAMHPLLKLHAGDELVLPPTTRALLNEVWVDALDSGIPQGHCSKLHAGPLTEGFAGIRNPKTGDQLQFEWNPAETNTLGLWLTRGGWHGHEHFAIEPTNADTDRLDQAVERKQCGLLAPSGTTTWQVRLRVGP